MKPKLILASQSPYRQELLKQVGLKFEAHPAKMDERKSELDFYGPTHQLAEYLSLKKAESLKSLFPNDVIIGSDQVLILEDKKLNKPDTMKEVVARLNQLNGKTHHLSTGLCVLHQESVYTTTVTSELKMHSLSQAEILNYAKLDQPLGCAGGYKIEKQGPLLFESVKTSDHHSIIGLPLFALLSYLRKIGILRP